MKFVLMILLMLPEICGAKPINDANLISQILPGKYLVSVEKYDDATKKAIQFPAAEEIKVNDESWFVCCYREIKPVEAKISNCKDCQDESGQPIYVAFFRKNSDDSYALIHSPFLIQNSQIVDKLSPSWVESTKVNLTTQAIVVSFHFSANVTIDSVFSYEKENLQLLNSIEASELTIKDLNNDGEKELVFKNYISRNVYSPPMIYRIVNGTLVDSSSNFQDFYKSVIDDYDRLLLSEKSEHTLIKMMKLKVYRITGNKNKADFGRALEAEIQSEIDQMGLTKPKNDQEKMVQDRRVKKSKILLEQVEELTEGN